MGTATGKAPAGEAFVLCPPASPTGACRMFSVPYLFKVLHAAFKDLHILLAVDILCHSIAASL